MRRIRATTTDHLTTNKSEFSTHKQNLISTEQSVRVQSVSVYLSIEVHPGVPLQQLLRAPIRRRPDANYPSVVEAFGPILLRTVENDNLHHPTQFSATHNESNKAGGRVTSSPTACRHMNLIFSSSAASRRHASSAASFFLFLLAASFSRSVEVLGARRLSHRGCLHRPHFL